MTKRIGLLTFDFDNPIGGQGRNFQTLYQALSRYCEGYSFLPIGPRVQDAPFFPHFANSPHAHLLYSLLFSFLPAGYWTQFDGLIINGGPGGIHLLRGLTIPTIVCANHTYTQQLRYLEAQWWKRWFLPIERRGYRYRSYFSAISSTTAFELEGEYGIEHGKITVIPTPINLELFSYSSEARSPCLLFVGRLEERKGVLDLVPLMSKVVARIPTARLSIAGEGGLKEALSRQITDAGLSSHIDLCGRVRDEELVRLYHASAVTVVPSLFEGLGMTSLESLSCGTPVVGRRVPGLVDTVKEGIDGFLCERIEEMSSSVIALLSDPSLGRRMGEAGRGKVERNASPQSVAERWQSVLDELLLR